MPASPYDALSEVDKPSFSSPLNGLTWPSSANAGRAFKSPAFKSPVNALGQPDFAAGRVNQETRVSLVVYQDSLVYRPLVVPDGKLSVLVTDGVVPIERVTVRLYYRPSGTVLQSKFTGADGVATFLGLSTTQVDEYTIVVFDPPGNPKLNALVYDYLTPRAV